ncbi:hypothetical protein ACFYPW_25980 [Micromonospora zamorensis]|uniref:hypothetical protein n=1 Tax=Micromonospora zamorensis TaxID=709883 RepID=UPI0036B71E0E
MLPPTDESYEVVQTQPVDAVWHAVLQIIEPNTAASKETAGHYVHHRPILTEAMQDGTVITYAHAALHETSYRVDMKFWGGEAQSCCPPNPPQPGK